MSRLIDADLLEPDADYDDGDFWAVSMAQIKSAPTIEERKKGKWGEHGECPFCSYIRQWEDDRFCGNCGTDMS